MRRKTLAFILFVLLTALLIGCSETSTTAATPLDQLDEAAFASTVKPYLDAYNLVLNESFGAETEEAYSMMLYENYVDETSAGVLVASGDVNDNGGVQSGGDYDGYTIDPAYCCYYKVTNFADMTALKAYLGEWLAEDVYADALAQNIVEIDGALYLQRGGRGYGNQYIDVDSAALDSANDIGNFIVNVTSYLYDENDGGVALEFAAKNGAWQVVSAAAIVAAVG